MPVSTIMAALVRAPALRARPRPAVRHDVAGQPVDGFDAQIAAICHSRRAVLATRNVKDFRNTGVVVLDPWTA